MYVSDTSKSTAVANPAESGSSTNKSNLGYKDFLNLLTVQLQNQDPFNPMNDTDFIAQMANFSQLEEVHNLSSNFSTFSARQQQLSSQEFLGKTVTVEPEGASAASGVVSAVSLGSDGAIYVTINGNKYEASAITSVAPSA